jgi:hypothetical protein
MVRMKPGGKSSIRPVPAANAARIFLAAYAKSGLIEMTGRIRIAGLLN